MKKLTTFIVLCIFSLLAAGCGGGGSDDAPGVGDISLQPAAGGGVPSGGSAEPSSGTLSAAPTAAAVPSGIGSDGNVGLKGWSGQTASRTHQVHVSAPGDLSQADTEYILTGNIVAPATAFTVRASRVTLNLNGHTITYANAAGSEKAHGVTVPAGSFQDVAIVNGEIRQGSSASETNAAQAGWHAVNISPGVPGLKVAGLRIAYRTPETAGIHAPWGKDGEIHHNEIEDQGATILNRHQLIAVIKINRAPGMNVHHNLIKRARQAGMDIGNGNTISHNEIHVDSHSTNSYGIVAYQVDGFTVHNNTIVGRGEHPIGIGMVSKSLNGKVHSNRIDVQNTRSGGEYGDTGSAGMRMTWGTDKTEVWDNHITVRAQANLLGPGQDSWGRGLWVGLPDPASSVLFRNNTIVANNTDGQAKAAGIAVVCGNESPGLVFRDNLVVSNWGNVVLADDYGNSNGYPQFIRNTFRKQDAHANYRTVKSDYKGYVSTGVFINNRNEGGAAIDSIDMQFDSSKLKDVAVGWEYGLTVKAGGSAAAGASVKIFDNTGAEVFSGTTDAGGRISANLIDYWATNNTDAKVAEALTRDSFGAYGNRIAKNPYKVRVTAAGANKEESFNITGNMNAEIAM